MQPNVILFSIVTMCFIIVHVNQVLQVHTAKRISMIAKELFARKIILNVLMESIHSIANVKQILNEVFQWMIHLAEIHDLFFTFTDWDGECVEQNPCDSSPCHPNATCYNLNGGQYRCMCPPTYTGVRCDEDIDECAVFPFICRNGGS